MSYYAVEMVGEVREVYIVEAASEDDARDRWHEGHLELSEAYGMGVESVRLSDEEDE